MSFLNNRKLLQFLIPTSLFFWPTAIKRSRQSKYWQNWDLASICLGLLSKTVPVFVPLGLCSRSLIQGFIILGNTYYMSKTGFLWSESCGCEDRVCVLRGSYSLSQNGNSPWATRTTCTEDLLVCVKTLRLLFFTMNFLSQCLLLPYVTLDIFIRYSVIIYLQRRCWFFLTPCLYFLLCCLFLKKWFCTCWSSKEWDPVVLNCQSYVFW